MAGWEKKKERNRVLMKKIGRNEEKQSTSSDYVGNKNARLEKFLKNSVIFIKL